MRHPDPNSIDYWYPRLVRAGVPVPRTRIFRTEVKLDMLLDDREPPGYRKFVESIQRAGAELGYPAFLRTGHLSGKHRYTSTCHLPGPEAVPAHVAALVEESALAGITGHPTNAWAVRELLPVDAPFTAFEGLPIARERRYFVRSGVVIAKHPYWPTKSIQDPSVPDWEERLAGIQRESPEEVLELTALTERAGRELGGYWSVDWLYSPGRGWVCTDCADGDRSFMWSDYVEGRVKI
jgi:hypothetical protein